MVGYYERKQSMAAIWCKRLAVVLPPYFILSILFHRFGMVQTPQLFALLAIGLVITLMSVVLALRAAADLWNKGYKGGIAMVQAMLIALAVLIPFGYYIVLALALPLANDVSTNFFDPPEFEQVAELREENEAAGMNQLLEYDTEYARELVTAYPRLGPRRYPAGSERVYQAVRQVILDQGWDVLSTVGAPEAGASDVSTETLDDNPREEGDGDDTKKGDSDGDNAAPNASPSEGTGETPDDIFIEVTITSLIVGYKTDAVIRIVSEDVNTLVDMRSSARWGAHDFGRNAGIIEEFMSQLDLALLGIAGEG